MSETVIHPISPVYDKYSRILILGSFPSVKSREASFFYAHPQNRFWRVISAVVGRECPSGIAEKRAFLLSERIALWDVIARCEIRGSSDSSVRNAEANDISEILEKSRVSAVFTNGQTAKKLYDKLIYPKVGIAAACLPSTSPANASWSFERLCESWSVIKEHLN